MHSRSGNIEMMINDEEDENTEEPFHSLLSMYQIGLVTSMKGSDFIFDCLNLLEYECHRINLKLGGSKKDSPDWIKNKTIINPINKKDNKCFKYAVTVALNYKKIEKNPGRMTKTKAFIDKYNWEGINYLSGKDDWKKLEKDNLTIALNVLYIKKGYMPCLRFKI